MFVNCPVGRVVALDSHWLSSCCLMLSSVSTYYERFLELFVVSFSRTHCENRPCYLIERKPSRNDVEVVNANESIPTKSANPYLWQMKLAPALRWRGWALDNELFPLRWSPFYSKLPAKFIFNFPRWNIYNFSVLAVTQLYALLTINFFFCRSLSLHKNTTADLNTKHIAWSSSPFFIFPRKSDIFSHSTPP